MSEPYLFEPGYYTWLAIMSIVFLTSLFWYKRLSRSFRLLPAIAGISLFFETRGLFTSVPGTVLYHLYLPLLCGLHGFLYAGIITNRRLRLIILYSIAAYIVLSAVNSVFIQDLQTVPVYSILIACLLLTGWGGLYFRQMMQRPVHANILRNGLLWYNTGVVYFYTISFFSWLPYKYFLQHQMDTTLLGMLKLSAGMIYYVVIGIGAYFGNKPRRENIFRIS